MQSAITRHLRGFGVYAKWEETLRVFSSNLSGITFSLNYLFNLLSWSTMKGKHPAYWRFYYDVYYFVSPWTHIPIHPHIRLFIHPSIHSSLFMCILPWIRPIEENSVKFESQILKGSTHSFQIQSNYGKILKFQNFLKFYWVFFICSMPAISDNFRWGNFFGHFWLSPIF